MPEPAGETTLFELLPIGAYRSSADGRQLRANAALVRLNGYGSEAEMLAAVNDIGREWYVDPRQRDRFMQAMDRDGHVLDFVSEVFRHKTRERIWIRENAHVVRGSDGRVLCYEGTVEDITAYHQAELALQASERRFRALTERSQVLTVVCNAEGRVAYVSPASMALLGHAAPALLGTHIFQWVHPQDIELAHDEFEQVLQQRNTGAETIARVRRADGSWCHLAMVANNCLSDPAVAGVVLNMRDVSGRVRAEEALRALNAQLEQRVRSRTLELEQARDEAEAASRAKSQFLSRMSHELRTPLNAILGFGQLLASDSSIALPAVQAGYLGEIVRSGERLLRLIDQLLELAHIDGDEPHTPPQPVNLATLAASCLPRLDALARRHGVRLELREVAGEMPIALADPVRLDRALFELLSHIVRHSAAGALVQLHCDAGDDEACIAVHGGAAAAQAFGPPAEDPAFDGTRSAWARSRRWVESMRGRIEQAAAEGGDLRIVLPRAPTPPLEVAAPRHCVLYIEDDPINLLLMEAMLAQRSELRLVSAPLPETGLTLARTEHPDLILLDIQLPGIDGFEVLRRLRADEATRRIPVVAISAHAMRADVERGHAAGFDDYLTKPLEQGRLLATLSRLLDA